MKPILVVIFLVFFALFSSCKSNLEQEKQQLLFDGLEQSADFSENILNFYFESNIQRNEAEYPDYYQFTAKNMRTVWSIFHEFDQICSDTVLQQNMSDLQLFEAYSKVVNSLNSMYLKTDTLHNPLKIDSKYSKKKLLSLLKNDLQNAKNTFLRKQIAGLSREIQRKHSFAFQILESIVKKDGNSLELQLFFSENTPTYTHQVIVDSIVNQIVNSKSTFSIDASQIFGKIDITTTQKGFHVIYGKVKIEGKKGFSLIPFKEKFEVY